MLVKHRLVRDGAFLFDQDHLPGDNRRRYLCLNVSFLIHTVSNSIFFTKFRQSSTNPILHMTKATRITERIIAYIVALILLQTLFFKFTGAAESKYIFSTLGLEPAGRIGSGIAELIAGVLLIIPATAVIGSIIALGVISGAIVSHLLILGIEVQGDHGQLFIYACIVLIGSIVILIIRKHELLNLINTVLRRGRQTAGKP